jgi:3-deoxy-manno-octulosonate cytidylyltransferase (CMP-KDO synthetase)
MTKAIDFHVLIPARLGSTRLPRKALADLNGRALIARTLDRARASGAASVHVATDDEAIAATVRESGGSAVLTSPEHRSGTDRLSEAIRHLNLPDQAVVVNLQGDEPLMPPECLRQVAELLAQEPTASIATLWEPVETIQQWHDPNVVKLVADGQGRALYFSRAAIPHARDRDWPDAIAQRHVGLYAYRASALREWPELSASPLEACESLEQLRALSAGWVIISARAARPIPVGVDTREDLERLRRELV